MGCLEILVQNATFRNSNFEQLQCLRAASPAGLCQEWRNCLTATPSSAHEAQLLTLMLAGGVGQTPASAVGSWGSAEAACMNPLIEDPESWDCDCYESMHSRCKVVEALPDTEDYTEEKCFRALFCVHDGVCRSWKHQFCRDVES